MRAFQSAGFVLVACALGVLPVAAQDARTVEVTPYVALGSAGSSPVGASVTFPISSKLSVETDVAYRRGEGNINALSMNASLLYFLPRVGRSTPYIAGGIGMAQYGAPVFLVSGLPAVGQAMVAAPPSGVSGLPVGTEPRLALTMNAGGGVKTTLNERVDLRTDVRWFKSAGKRGSEHFRVAQGVGFDIGHR